MEEKTAKVGIWAYGVVLLLFAVLLGFFVKAILLAFIHTVRYYRTDELPMTIDNYYGLFMLLVVVIVLLSFIWRLIALYHLLLRNDERAKHAALWVLAESILGIVLGLYLIQSGMGNGHGARFGLPTVILSSILLISSILIRNRLSGAAPQSSNTPERKV